MYGDKKYYTLQLDTAMEDQQCLRPQKVQNLWIVDVEVPWYHVCQHGTDSVNTRCLLLGRLAAM